MQIAAAVGEAVAKAINGSTAPREHGADWAGVAGRRIFTARVKEYSGATSGTTFGAWAANFKANIPKDMRDALEWAERQVEPITDDIISGTVVQKWDEETWRCLAGVLKGNWETLRNTLKSGQCLEL